MRTSRRAGTSDRGCAKWKVCNKDKEFQVAAPTGKSDRKCKTLTACKDGETEATKPTATSDRTCIKSGLSCLKLYQAGARKDGYYPLKLSNGGTGKAYVHPRSST